jgi:hypothetical protein
VGGSGWLWEKIIIGAPPYFWQLPSRQQEERHWREVPGTVLSRGPRDWSPDRLDFQRTRAWARYTNAGSVHAQRRSDVCASSSARGMPFSWDDMWGMQATRVRSGALAHAFLRILPARQAFRPGRIAPILGGRLPARPGQGAGNNVSMPRSVWRHGDLVTLPLRDRVS